MKYWYEYRLRGCSLGAQPKGFIEVNHEHGKWGAVAYDRPLTQKELIDYELNDMNKTTNRLKELAKEMVWIQDEMGSGKLYELEEDELREHSDKIKKEILKDGHNIDLWIRYMDEYRHLSVADYNKWINS
ncbi:TPA: hypothetical protein ACORDH_002821 [Bacillus cereus]